MLNKLKEAIKDMFLEPLESDQEEENKIKTEEKVNVQKTPLVSRENTTKPIVKTEPLQEVKSTVSISPIFKDDKPKVDPEVKFEKEKKVVVEEKRYVPKQVISPMFGLSEKEAVQQKRAEIEATTQQSKTSPIGAVVSPMYGVEKNTNNSSEQFSQTIEEEMIPSEHLNFNLEEILEVNQEFESDKTILHNDFEEDDDEPNLFNLES